MGNIFNIYIEQLRDGKEEKIDEILDPSFLDIQENELKFEKPVALQGIAYLADQELVINWDIETEATIPCSICNEGVSIPIRIENFYYSEPLEEMKSGVYDYKDLLRETILLEVPLFAECSEGQCPKRKEFKKYLKKVSNRKPEDEGYQPFADLDWKSE